MAAPFPSGGFRRVHYAARRVPKARPTSPCFDTKDYLVFKASEFEKRGIPLLMDASTQTEEATPGKTTPSRSFEPEKPPVSGNTSTSFSFELEKPPVVNKLLQGLKEILLNSKHSDFVLNVKGAEFKVHKVILEAQSPVFAAMLGHDTKEKADGIANIDDCEPPTMAQFLNFLYTGRAGYLSSDNVLDLYEVADKYQVTELSNLCIMYMKDNISIENFCDILVLSLRHHVRELTEVATEFFLQNSTEIAVTAKWGTFLEQNPVTGNELFLKALNLKK